MTKSRGIRTPRGVRKSWVDANQGKHLCGCGCGEAIALRLDHFNEGIPRYIHGHNPGPGKRERTPCECGCGELASRGRRFVSGHNSRGRTLGTDSRSRISAAMSGHRNHRFGVRPENYAGGRQRSNDGYVQVLEPGHPYADARGRVMEHRLVLERHLRRADPGHEALVILDGIPYLRPDFDVHHRNGDRTDNRVENLAAMSHADHARLHANLRV